MHPTHKRALTPQFRRLFSTMGQACDPVTPITAHALRSLPEPGTLPLPSTIWLFFSVIEYHQRQKWARRLLRERRPDAVPPKYDLCCEDQPVEFYLPGAPEWDVTLECTEPQFACLTNRVKGDFIFTDVSNECDHWPIHLDRWYLLIARGAGDRPAADRLLELHPSMSFESQEADWESEEELVANGMLTGFVYGQKPWDKDLEPDKYHLTETALRYEQVVLDYLQSWQAPERQLWMAAVIGDWDKAHRIALAKGDPEQIRITKDRADSSRETHLRQLRNRIGDGPANYLHLRMLRDLNSPDLRELISSGLKRSDWGFDAAASFLKTSDDPRWCRDAFDLLNPDNSLTGLTDYLLRHDYRVNDVLDAMVEQGFPDSAGWLALEHAPDLAPAYFRRALRWIDDSIAERDLEADMAIGHVDLPAWSAAIRLASIDAPWTREEIVNALAELNPTDDLDRYRAFPLVLALSKSVDDSAREIALAWEVFYDEETLQAGSSQF